MSTTAHIGVVLNPAKTDQSDLEEALAPALEPKTQVSWFHTTVEDPGQGATQAALEAGADLVVAAGGDGTVRAVAEYLGQAQAEVELGILPQGTGNLLARNLGLPLSNATKAAALAVTGKAQSVDLGWVRTGSPGNTQSHAFAVMAGIGIDAHMIIETAEGLKDKVGWLAYLEALGRALAASKVIDMDVQIDAESVAKDQAHTLMVGNCGTLTAGITLLPEADPTDGKLDLLVLSADGVSGWLDTLQTMVWDNGLKRMVTGEGEVASSDSVTNRQFSTLTVELDEPRVLELDGDEAGECTRMDFSVQPGALRIRSLEPQPAPGSGR